MFAYWLTFKNRGPGCIEASTEAEAIEISKAHGEVATCNRLPYPADPRLHKYIDPKWGACPSFCYKPNQCVGKSCCPQNHSCTD